MASMSLIEHKLCTGVMNTMKCLNPHTTRLNDVVNKHDIKHVL